MVLIAHHHHVHEHPVGRAGVETKHDDLGSVARPLTHSQVQVTVDLLVLEEPHLPDQLELAVDVELPPVEVIYVEGEVVIPTAAGVGEDIAATLGKSQEDMACIEKILIYDVLEGHADPGGQLPEKTR